MADVAPFKPYRFSSKAGRLADLVTQPYDKITRDMQRRYLALSPYNLVRIVLGERFAGDSATDNVYTRAAAHLREWIAGGILEREPARAFYAYFQTFEDPDTGECLTRKGFIGLGAVEPYSAGVIHRHEHTHMAPKEDRLELLRSTRAHFEQLFLLYPDPAGEVDAILDRAAAESEPLGEVTDEYGAEHRIWRVAEPDRVSAIRLAMRPKKLVIADGHHRYETALAFRQERPDLEDARWAMMTFVNMDAPGLRVLATHRLLDAPAPADFADRLRARFRVREAGSVDVLRRAWAEPHPALYRIGVAFPSGEVLLVEADRPQGGLDVAFLHEKILGEMLGIGEEDVRQERGIRYVRGADVAREAVRSGDAKLAFLLEPVSVADVARVSFSGGVMPQKSTDFYPKLLSGLTVYPIEK